MPGQGGPASPSRVMMTRFKKTIKTMDRFMKKNNCVRLALASLMLAMANALTYAQSIYTPYAFANFVGLSVRPTSVAVDGAGNLYVAEFDNDTIQKVTPA